MPDSPVAADEGLPAASMFGWSGKKHCRMHGGAPGPGAPRGNRNALKHGLYTREAIVQRRRLRELIRQARDLLLKIG